MGGARAQERIDALQDPLCCSLCVPWITDKDLARTVNRQEQGQAEGRRDKDGRQIRADITESKGGSKERMISRPMLTPSPTPHNVAFLKKCRTRKPQLDKRASKF